MKQANLHEDMGWERKQKCKATELTLLQMSCEDQFVHVRIVEK